MNCLFCKSDSNTFHRQEHIIPESLGNTTFVLTKVVCDKCNAYFSKLEDYFIHHHMSSAIRLLAVNKTKKGRRPSQRLISGRGERTPTGSTKWSQGLIPGKEEEQLSITLTDREMTIQASYFLEDADATKLSRTLAKMALETLLYTTGEIAYERDFDAIRQYARYGRGRRFVPFLWASQHATVSDVRMCKVEHSAKGIFFFGVVAVPGSYYFVPLHRFDDQTIFNDLAQRFTLNKVTAPGAIKRDPIKFVATARSRGPMPEGEAST